jgi:hypothetical protein
MLQTLLETLSQRCECPDDCESCKRTLAALAACIAYAAGEPVAVPGAAV